MPGFASHTLLHSLTVIPSAESFPASPCFSFRPRMRVVISFSVSSAIRAAFSHCLFDGRPAEKDPAKPLEPDAPSLLSSMLRNADKGSILTARAWRNTQSRSLSISSNSFSVVGVGPLGPWYGCRPPSSFAASPYISFHRLHGYDDWFWFVGSSPIEGGKDVRDCCEFTGHRSAPYRTVGPNHLIQWGRLPSSAVLGSGTRRQSLPLSRRRKSP